MDLNGKKFLVVGTGISGIAAAKLLAGQGFPVILYDGNQELEIEEVRKKSPLLEQVEILAGQLPGRVLKDLDIAVFSPGVPTDLPLAGQIRQAGMEIWGEIELA